MEVTSVTGALGSAEAARTVARVYGKNQQRPQEAAPRREAETDAEASTPESETAAALMRLAEPVERFMSKVGVEIKFLVHEQTGQVQAEVRDASGQKVLRKVPADEMLRLAASIREMSDRFMDRAL
ncbi:flagellar protein FlaG [Desulfocurvus sp.]|jgi:flagellar protein FlaG|uniref:flagellar protein FlaG n=1 Tax=Desulfocurvus sp. TaxID=2871698 RepID=UPI0025C50864|nr:flagellar protein FlaG [Desulfocurvus sp.]MCK9238972.1 flagellar protein FlaG [Desulfocurvus sp.]